MEEAEIRLEMVDGKRFFLQNGTMSRKKTTVYLEPDLLRAAKVWAARTGRKDYEIFEDALRSFLGLDVMRSIWAGSDLGEEESLDLAYKELHAARK